jgi:hypothetical protein
MAMEKLRAGFRLFVAFVLGALLGVIGTVVVINSGNEIGDSFIRGAPLVKSLQRDLDEARSHRDSVSRRFEQLASQLEQVEKRYGDLSRRLELIESGLHRTGQAKPSAPAPEAAEAPQPAPAEPSGVR